MKFTLLVISFSLVGNVFATTITKVCSKKAEQAVAKSVDKNQYDKNGFDTLNCFLAPNNAVVICDVAAYKGDGAATDTFRVVLNKSCSRSFRVELTGEE